MRISRKFGVTVPRTGKAIELRLESPFGKPKTIAQPQHEIGNLLEAVFRPATTRALLRGTLQSATIGPFSSRRSPLQSGRSYRPIVKWCINASTAAETTPTRMLSLILDGSDSTMPATSAAEQPHSAATAKLAAG